MISIASESLQNFRLNPAYDDGWHFLFHGLISDLIISPLSVCIIHANSRHLPTNEHASKKIEQDLQIANLQTATTNRNFRLGFVY